MTEERQMRPLSSYLEFGLRLHWEDFSQLTAVVLLVYLPFSFLAIYIHPPVETVFKSAEKALALIPGIMISQLIIRVVQTFVLVLVVLRLEAKRERDENLWDFTEAFSRMGRVVVVDLVYFLGLQFVGILFLWFGLLLTGILMGGSPLGLPVAISVVAVLVIGPAIRYYFATLVSLLHGTSIRESFRMAGSVSNGGERLIATLVMTYMMIWFVIWQLFHGVFGGTIFGQVMVQAGVLVSSIPYFFSGYLLYMDLLPGADDMVTLQHVTRGGDAGESTEDDVEGEGPGENHPESD
ncbi:MAG: hypothetical protein HOC91_03695 [Nitrospinaceae bacterium]|jgi:hypothetical protein|nr:hypothetical protein [Nitrospinaceae bacterium]MBT3435329.1 hypothetical protein [Nitrospinaceae bacterium]MBT3820616.1 hypothetical protein [Nitrospinaceae bacterium]MBT4429596.1 hypothetical protein [Nitrospinaceae bacterium]MBT5366510.1 hypothetical protein [Nitrospinaceae bacterium]